MPGDALQYGIDPRRLDQPRGDRGLSYGCEIFLDKNRPDLVWTYGGDPVSMAVQQMAKQRGIPILFGLHNFAYRDAGPFRMADRVIVPTEFARQHYRESWGWPAKSCRWWSIRDGWSVARNALTLPLPAAPTRRPDRTEPLPEGERTFVTFVNPEPRKGVHVFARIAEVLSRRRPDIPLLLVEGASKASFLPKLGIDLSGLKNCVMPNTPDARQFLAATKILLMPSLMENAALVAMEAMFNGIPVLASNRGGLPETVGDAGFLFDIPARYTPETRDVPTAEEVEPWVETIIRLWDDAAEYERWSRAARERAQQWHPDRLARFTASSSAASPTSPARRWCLLRSQRDEDGQINYWWFVAFLATKNAAVMLARTPAALMLEVLP